MKLRKLLYAFSVCLFLFTACDDDNENDLELNKNNDNIIVKERDPNYPLIISRKNISQTKSTSSFDYLRFEDYLGRSFKPNVLPLADAENLKFQVIDSKKFIKDNEYCVKKQSLNKGLATSYSYSNFNRFTKNSQISKKVRGGFKLNLGLFSIGARRSVNRLYTSSVINNDKSVFGELYVQYRADRYTITNTNYVNKNIILNYLTDIFKNELCNSTPSQILNDYGYFVITDFITGGMASSIYSGYSSSYSSVSTKEKNMNSSINSSFAFKFKTDSSGDISADFGIGEGFCNGSSTQHNINSLRASMKTIGGDLTLTSFTVPKKIDEMSLNLTNWYHSLSDKSKHAIIDISEDGLIPLHNFILEEDLKKQFLSYLENGIDKQQELIEPYIRICESDNGPMAPNIYSLQLVTRYNSIVNLKFIYAPLTKEQIGKIIAKNGIDQVPNIFKIKTVKVTDWNEIMNPSISGLSKISFTDFNTKSLKKYTYNGKIYLLSTEGKCGFTFYDDYLLDTYCIRDFVEKLPEIKMNPLQLFEYKLSAL